MKQTTKVRAAIVYAQNGPYEYGEIEMDNNILPNEVKIKMVACGICHSDEMNRTVFNQSWPIVLGHEGAGIVEAVGSEVTRCKVGDHVVILNPFCGKCEACKAGDTAFCEDMWYLFCGGRPEGTPQRLSIDGKDITQMFGQASFAEYNLVHEGSCHVIDPDLDLRLFAPIGCGVATGSMTVLKALSPKVGSSIAIFGLGGVGMSALMGANVAGCTSIIGLAYGESKFELAKELGATATIATKGLTAEEIAAKILEANRGKPVDYVVECIGRQTNVDAAKLCIRYSGEISIPASMFELNLPTLGPMMNRNLKFSSNPVGNTRGNGDQSQTVRLICDLYKQGKFPLEKICKFYTFDQIQEAIDDMHSGKAIKPVIVF